MGIRIKKILGYGIKGLRYSKKRWCLTDKRINPLGYLGEHTKWEDQERTWTQDGFLQYAKHHLDDFDYSWLRWEYDKENNERAIEVDFYDYVWSDLEFGIPGVVVLQLPMRNGWYRSDDTIDYYEHTLNHNGAENYIRFLDTPIYPYHGYVDSKTGDRFTGREGSLANELWYSIRSKRGLRGKRARSFNRVISVCVEQLEFGSLSEAKKRVVPMIPEILVVMAKYLCIFEDESTIWQLRPAIYTYWS